MQKDDVKVWYCVNGMKLIGKQGQCAKRSSLNCVQV